jgi:hypothetical protein
MLKEDVPHRLAYPVSKWLSWHSVKGFWCYLEVPWLGRAISEIGTGGAKRLSFVGFA